MSTIERLWGTVSIKVTAATISIAITIYVERSSLIAGQKLRQCGRTRSALDPWVVVFTELEKLDRFNLYRYMNIVYNLMEVVRAPTYTIAKFRTLALSIFGQQLRNMLLAAAMGVQLRCHRATAFIGCELHKSS